MPMFCESKVYWLPRDENHPNAYEDSYCYDERGGLAVIADGVSGGIFSNRWANILTQATLSGPPNLDDFESYRNWLAPYREEWNAGIDFERMGFFHRRKMRQVGGGYSTLLWLDVSQVEEADEADQADPFRYVAGALGDCCLFHVRDNQMLFSFPMTTSDEFGRTPLSIGSMDLNQDDPDGFLLCEGTCRAGDLFVLCTDAIAKYLFEVQENGEEIDWADYVAMDNDNWHQRITELREAMQLEPDDTTMLLLGVGEPEPDDATAEITPSEIIWCGDVMAELAEAEAAQAEVALAEESDDMPDDDEICDVAELEEIDSTEEESPAAPAVDDGELFSELLEAQEVESAEDVEEISEDAPQSDTVINDELPGTEFGIDDESEESAPGSDNRESVVDVESSDVKAEIDEAEEDGSACADASDRNDEMLP